MENSKSISQIWQERQSTINNKDIAVLDILKNLDAVEDYFDIKTLELISSTGSYGSVWKIKSKLDDKFYAIKKFLL